MSVLHKIRVMLRWVFGWLARIVATVLILLALLVGVARLLLPEASSFKEDIRVGVKQATGLQIDFDLISAGLSVYGPELRFSRTAIQWPDGSELAAVDDIAVSLDVLAWVAGDGILPGRVYIKGTAVEVRYDEDGQWTIQGHKLEDFLPSESRGTMDDWPESTLELADVSVNFKNLQRNGPRIEGVINNFSAALDNGRIELSADIDPGVSYGRSLSVQAEIPLQLLAADERDQSDEPWSIAAVADDFRLEKWIDIAEMQNLPVVDSAGDAEVQVDFRGIQPVGISALLELEQLKLAHYPSEPILIDWLDGQFIWRTSAGGWLLQADNLRMERDSRDWPDSEFSLRYATGPEVEGERIEATASFLRVEDLLPFIQAVIPEQLAERGLDGQVMGDFSDLGLTLTLFDKKLETFAIDAAFENAGYLSADNELDVAGFSGRLSGNEGGGNLEVNTDDARLGLAKVFRNVLELSSLTGLAIWRAGPQGHRVLADGISLETPDGAAQASLELTFDSDFGNPVIDLNGEASLKDARRAPFYLPNIIPEKVQNWLDESLQGGTMTHADIRLSGPLKEFPYDHDEGEFLIGVDFVDGVLRYAPGWPSFMDASGRLVFDGVSMYTTENSLTLANTKLRNITVRMDDMRTGELLMAGDSQLQLVDLKAFLQESPIGDVLGPIFNDVEVAGTGQGAVELLLPIRNISEWSLDGRLDIADAEIGLAGIAPRLSAVTGSTRIRNARISADALTGRLLDHDVAISVEPIDSPTSAFSHRAFLNGELTVSDIQQTLGLPSTSLLNGAIGVRGQALFPGGKGDAAPFRLAVRSDLRGMRSNFPAPLDKSADAPEGVQIELEFPREGVTHVYGSLERGLSWAIEAVNDGSWGLTRGVIMRGVDLPELPVGEGLAIAGDFDSFNLDEWISLFADDAAVSAETVAAEWLEPANKVGWQSLFNEVDVQLGELFALGHRFVDVDAEVLFRDADWDIDLSGPWIEGHLLVPYDFAGTQPVSLELERLLLLEPLVGEGDDSDTQLDPRTLPAVRGFVNDFSLGSLRLGRLDADLRRVAGGLKAEQLQTRSESFGTDVSYDWLVVDNAQRSRLHMDLNSTNVEDTLQKLGYSPLIAAEKASVVADLLWEGGPGMDSIYASTGTVKLTIRDGTVTEVSPGSGRILGLLSITALPRRLSLDFKDMTDDGLAFDKIKGSFRIDFGDAWTCDLGLEGSVADMGVVGRTGILAQDYEQIAAIRPHVSNLVPVAGAFLAGPTIGVATLLITQILKKPLSSIGESYYSISGPWDDTQFIKSEQSDLDTAAFAACESQLPPLSPEEIQAIEELIANPTINEMGSVDQSSALPAGLE